MFSLLRQQNWWLKKKTFFPFWEHSGKIQLTHDVNSWTEPWHVQGNCSNNYANPTASLQPQRPFHTSKWPSTLPNDSNKLQCIKETWMNFDTLPGLLQYQPLLESLSFLLYLLSLWSSLGATFPNINANYISLLP